MKAPSTAWRRTGFTLVELLVSMTVILLLLAALVSITDSTQKIWSNTTAKVAQFQDAREAFDAITHRLSAVTLNTYLDYVYPLTAGVPDTTRGPTGYARQSELRFITGLSTTLFSPSLLPGLSKSCVTHAMFFQAPVGYANASAKAADLNLLLNTCGYYLQFGDDTSLRPPFISNTGIPLRYRFRLMEMVEPSDSLTVYKYTNGNATYHTTEWYADPLISAPPVQVRAENILALVILPKLTTEEDPTAAKLAPNYLYDSTTANSDASINSKNQLPPVIQVTMVAVDELSYSRFQGSSTILPTKLGLTTLFQTVGDTTNPANTGYAQDLQTLEASLLNARLNYRVFTTSISIKAAKWSRGQIN